jgi:hypothetical protein
VHETLRELVHLVAPRRGSIDLEPDTDLGFGGYGVTIVEYLRLLDRVGGCYGARLPQGGWPHSVEEIADQLTCTGIRSASSAQPSARQS